MKARQDTTAANSRSSITVDKATRLAVQAVQADMQRDARRNLTLGDVVGQLADGWQRRSEHVDEDTSQPAAGATARPSPCSGCGGGCEGSITRAWRFVGAALGFALIALAVAGAAWVRAGLGPAAEASEGA